MDTGFFGNVQTGKRDLRDYFIVPPFSVLDTTSKIWRNRKNKWLSITGDLTTTKEGVLGDARLISKINQGSSNFDPVLAEILYKWFNVPGGKVLDPFGGEQTKGVVCGELGFEYHGCEFRGEQVDFNKQCTSGYDSVFYYKGDSNHLNKIIKHKAFDFCLTSPPYYDLEVYSKDDMSTLGTYKQFMQQYKNIFKHCYNMLKDDRFLVVKIAEIRNKKTGAYRNFVGDNIKIFKKLGFHYYNEIIVLNSVGTLPLRVGKWMDSTRKIGKRHQNILVFYKGNLKKINTTFNKLIGKNNYYD